MAVLAMFPLGTVLVPTAVLPLHVFEPRYRALVKDCLAADRELGIVLIERGSEVGGGDVRSDVGTRARIVDAVELPDGRWGLQTVGLHRIRVREWLPDDPYPQAVVEEWPDPAPSPGHPDALVRVLERLRTTLALAAEAGVGVPDLDRLALAEDPVQAGYELAALAPVGPLDRQRLLTAASPDDRLTQLAAMLDDVIELIRFQLGGA